MIVAAPDFYPSIHRTLVDMASVMLLVIGLIRIILHDLKSLRKARHRNRSMNSRQHGGLNGVPGTRGRQRSKTNTKNPCPTSPTQRARTKSL